MKYLGVLIVAVFALATPCLSQVRDDFAGRLIRAYEAGRNDRLEQEAHKARMEYYRQQIELMKRQNELMQQRLKQQEQAAILEQSTRNQVNATLSALSAKYPDWRTYEPAMVRLGQTVAPGGMTGFEYVETLYLLAKQQARLPMPSPEQPGQDLSGLFGNSFPQVIFVPAAPVAQTAITTKLGPYTLTNWSNGFSATSFPLGPFRLTNFSDGTSATASRFGPFTTTRFSNGTSATSVALGASVVTNYSDGLSGTTTFLGPFTLTNFTDGSSATSNRLGNFTMTTYTPGILYAPLMPVLPAFPSTRR